MSALNYFQGIRTCFSGMFCEVLEAVIPNRTKRLIVLSSLCPKLISRSDLTQEYLALLNTQLSLCREEEALKLPMAMSDQIWPINPVTIENDNNLSDSEYDIFARRILEKIPEWLRYDRDTVIASELSTLLRISVGYQHTHNHHLTNHG